MVLPVGVYLVSGPSLSLCAHNDTRWLGPPDKQCLVTMSLASGYVTSTHTTSSSLMGFDLPVFIRLTLPTHHFKWSCRCSVSNGRRGCRPHSPNRHVPWFGPQSPEPCRSPHESPSCVSSPNHDFRPVQTTSLVFCGTPKMSKRDCISYDIVKRITT